VATALRTQAKIRLPKTKCCTSKPKCARCPLRMLADGTLPEGLTVKKRRLVDVDSGRRVKKVKNKKRSKAWPSSDAA
jgi:hypothetical protein